MGLTSSDTRYMELAFAVGSRQCGRTWPNPAVGCVLVKNDIIIARGWTARGGRPHAETRALATAGERARGATAYVTLEPCAHQGRTRPCAQALIDAGVARVVSAMEDPDPRVAGAGHRLLAAAGIAVSTNCLHDRARDVHEGHCTRITTGRPGVTLKLAMTLDGRVSGKVGTRTAITGPQTQRLCHHLRSQHDAILVGRGTIEIDNPQLTVRLAGIEDQPVRIVLDSQLRIAEESALIRTAASHPVWICHGATRIPESAPDGVTHIACRTGSDGRIDLMDGLAVLGQRGMTRIFCEGGPRVATSLLKAGLVDRVYIFMAGTVLGSRALAAVGPLPNRPEFTLQSVDCYGNDSVCCWVRGSAATDATE